MMFSSCLMISADDWKFDSSTTFSISSDDKNLIFEVSGDNAEKYLESVANGTGYIKLWSNDPRFDGRIVNKSSNDITRDGKKLLVSKQTLLDKGFYNGHYLFNLVSSDTYYMLSESDVDLGSKLDKNQIDDLKLVGEIPTPKDGESTTIDKTKLYLADANGNKVSNDEFDFYWEILVTSANGSQGFSSVYTDTFVTGETYRLAVVYAYVGGNSDSIKLKYGDQEFSKPTSWSIYDLDNDGEYESVCKNNIIACTYGKTSDDTYLKTYNGVQFRSGEYVAKSSKDIEITTAQDNAGDLVIKATGNDAKEFIDTLYQGHYTNYQTEKSLYADIQLIHSDGYQGYIKNQTDIYDDGSKHEEIHLNKVDDNTLKMSKDDLVKCNFIDGDYKVEFRLNNGVNYPKTNITLNTGKTVTPNKSSKINIQSSIKAPVEGDSTTIDTSKITITDASGEVIPIITTTSEGVGCMVTWAEPEENNKYVYYQITKDKTFIAGKTYYLRVDYYYYGVDKYGDEPIEVTSNKSFENIGTNAPGAAGGTGLRLTSMTTFIGSYEAKKLVKDETIAEVTESSKVKTSTLTTSVETLQNQILTKEDKAELANGTEIKTYLTISDKEVSDKDKKTVEDNLKGNTIGQILDIKLMKQVGENEATLVSELNKGTGQVEISLKIDDSLVNKDSSMQREYKVVRIHENKDTGKSEVATIDATYDVASKTVKFKTDRFSTYALVYKDAKKPISTNNNDSNDSNHSDSKVVTCEEYMKSKNWTWSESKKACVYKVSNTSAE